MVRQLYFIVFLFPICLYAKGQHENQHNNNDFFVNKADIIDSSVLNSFSETYTYKYVDTILGVDVVELLGATEIKDSVFKNELINATKSFKTFLNFISIVYYGEAFFRPNVTTKLFLLSLAKDGDKAKLLVGINIFAGRAVSVFILSERSVMAGFSTYTYSEYNKGKFLFFLSCCFDISGVKRVEPKVYEKVKMSSNGRLY